MALGKRRQEQQEMWVATADLPKSPGHVFYRKLNELLSESGFDRLLEELCQPHYAQVMGRPGIPPGVYFRMLLVGYFEGLSSQRGIAWRCSDSLSLREFLGLAPTEDSPDHSSLTRVRDRLPYEVHAAVFEKVLKLAHEKKLLRGKTVGVDSTTLEANAALKSIVRRDTGESWKEYVLGLMREAGLVDEEHPPSDEEVRRFDKARKDKRVPNAEWVSPSDPDSRIAKMKDGTTHLAYKAEHVVDLESDLLLAAEVYPADQADSQTLVESVIDAQEHLLNAGVETEIEEAAADKGYHSAEALELAGSLEFRTYIPEPELAHDRTWTDKPPEQKKAVYNNRRRMSRAKGKALQRARSELVERSFAHTCETGGGRRTWLRGLEKVRKRWLIQAAARNLGVLMRKLFGLGTARSQQAAGGLAARWFSAPLGLLSGMLSVWRVLLANLERPLKQSCSRTAFTFVR
jgi:transposase